MFGGPAAQIVDADRGDAGFLAQHGAAERLVRPGGRVEMIVDDVVGLVAGFAQLLQHDILFTGEIFGLEMRLADEIGDQIDTEVRSSASMRA
jgi:hypothetical protein